MIPLVISSHFFLVPAYIAFKNSYYGYATISLITTIVSVNFWRNPIPGFRRNLDLVVAKISFTIYFLNGLSNVLNNRTNIVSSNLPAILICYYASNVLSKYNLPEWTIFHFMFHFFVAYEQILVFSGSRGNFYIPLGGMREGLLMRG